MHREARGLDPAERVPGGMAAWIAAQEGDFERPAFYTACKTDEGIAILSGWK